MTIAIPSNDPALEAQKGLSQREKWKPKMRSDAALIASTKVWAESLAKAWNNGRAVTIRVMHNGVAASTTTDEGDDIIFINQDLLRPKTAQDLLALVGLIIHELGHLHHTPKSDDRYTQELVAAGIFKTANMVEDGKQEMKKIKIRPGYTKYLKYAVLKHLLETTPAANIHRVYPLVAGRHYLPESLRRQARIYCVAKYGEDIVAEFDRLLREFFAINPLAEPMEAKEIVQAIHDLFPMDRPTGCTPNIQVHEGRTEEDPKDWNPYDGESKGEPKESKDGEGDGEEEGTTSKDDGETDNEGSGPEEGEDSEDNEDFDWDPDDEEDEDSDSSEDGDPIEEGGEASDPQDGEDPSTGSDNGDPVDGEGDDGGDPTGEAQAGTEKPDEDIDQSTEQLSPEDFLKKLKEMNDQLEEQLADDYEEDIELIKSEAFGDGAIRKPVANEKTAQAELVSALKRLADAAKGGIDRRKPKGRLALGRYIRGMDRPGIEKITFDKFRPDVSRALNMEIVLAVDNSGSIRGVEEELAGTVWALVTALESVGGPSVTVILWNSEFQVWKVPSDKWRAKYVPTIKPTGGTTPVPVLKYSREIFKHSRRKQKLLFILTDGVWGHMDQARTVITEMNRTLDVESFIIGFAGFVPENAEASYGVQGASSGGLVTIADFIWNTVYDRLRTSVESSR